MFAVTGNAFVKGLRALLCTTVVGLALAACSGSDGSAGAAGPAGPAGPPGSAGPPGPTGPILALDVTTARLITGTITSVGGTAAQPTVSFRLVDQNGQPLKGLPASTIRFTAAKLVPGTGGGSSEWVPYVTRTDNPIVGVGWGTTPTRQATAEAATAAGATYVDNLDGTYTFKFSKDLGTYTAANAQGPAIAFDGSLTHRIGFEIRGTGLNATNNPVYTYVPATGATTSLPEQRDIVNTAECSACHDKLAFHGGPRTDVQYCVTCHNPSTTDAQSGNSVDMKVMVHKIHRGIELPSVVAAGSTAPAQGVGYTIWGNGNSLNNFNGIEFPQDQRNCTTCHRESDTSTPQASNFRTVVNSAACGTCHDDVNFATGANHNGIVVTDADCQTCHGPTSTINNGDLRTAIVHKIPEVEAAKAFAYTVVGVTNTAPGATPSVTIKVTDPTNANAPYNLAQAGGPFQIGNASVRVDLAWNTSNFTNAGSGSATATTGSPSQPISIDFKTGATNNGDGTFTKAASRPVPATGVGGSGVAYLEGRPNVVLPGGTTPTALAVNSNGLTFAITDSAPVARRQVVDIKKCNDCHNQLSLHGNNRTGNTELCTTCHNPNATDISRRTAGVAGADGLFEQAIDFKWMIHAIHSGEERATNGRPTTIYGFGGSVNSFADVGYPGDQANCEGCHKAGTYYPVDATKVLGTTYETGASRVDPSDDKVASPNAAACGACHVTQVAAAHMQQNGGAPGAIAGTGTSPFWGKAATATGFTNVQSTTETCALCHGPGATADVKLMHRVGDFKFN